ncbi:MarR family transcriptional regulator [Arthrobacter glacialis]|uniref:MarR family transcriptional regulator n=1 Tax=Arthrobacter glacialis TaxID=1664 RepID=UPI000CD3BE28|nr:MarR family transcriptional regulator [Arthrobacter glacialis]POH58100.1 MarR family transcriptional regulator [Arthrobacter glacialis]
MFVMTIDQRGSRIHGDKVPPLLSLLANLDMVLPFERSVGDEIQGVFEEPSAVVEAVARVLRERDWYIGIGLGGVDLPLPKHSREASGSAFVAAREAVEAAKKTGERVPLCVKTPLATAAAARWVDAAEAVLVLAGDVIRRRSDAEWRVLDALAAAPAASQKDVAQQLGISPQAVSKAIVRSGRHEVRHGREAATLLLEHAKQAHNVGATR